MAEPSYALRDVAPLVDCPDCSASAGELCQDAQQEPVTAHEGRRQAARTLILRLAEEAPDN